MSIFETMEDEYRFACDTLAYCIQDVAKDLLNIIEEFKNTERSGYTYEEWFTSENIDFDYAWYFKEYTKLEYLAICSQNPRHRVYEGVVIDGVIHLDNEFTEYFLNNRKFTRLYIYSAPTLELALIDYITDHIIPLRKRCEFERKLTNGDDNSMLEYYVYLYIAKYLNNCELDVSVNVEILASL